MLTRGRRAAERELFSIHEQELRSLQDAHGGSDFETRRSAEQHAGCTDLPADPLAAPPRQAQSAAHIKPISDPFEPAPRFSEEFIEGAHLPKIIGCKLNDLVEYQDSAR